MTNYLSPWLFAQFKAVLSPVYGGPRSREAAGCLSWGEVNAILCTWIALRVGGGGANRGAQVTTPWGQEAGWKLWSNTVATKVTRCPVVRLTLGENGGVRVIADHRNLTPEHADWRMRPGDEVMWDLPAVEIATMLAVEIAAERERVADLAAFAARTQQKEDLWRAGSHKAAMKLAGEVLADVKDRKEYRAGMNILARLFGEAGATDAEFLWCLKSGVREER